MSSIDERKENARRHMDEGMYALKKSGTQSSFIETDRRLIYIVSHHIIDDISLFFTRVKRYRRAHVTDTFIIRLEILWRC